MKNPILLLIFSLIISFLNGQSLELSVNSGVRERLINFEVQDAPNDYFTFLNGTNVSGQLSGMINGHHGSDERGALTLLASTSSANDIVSGTALMTFDSRISPQPYELNLGDHLPLVNRILFAWQNGGEQKMVLTSAGFLGVGTSIPKSKIQIKEGDVYIEDMNSGIILTDPNGGCWRITIDANGTLLPTSISCP